MSPTVQETGQAAQRVSDEQVLSWATAAHRAVLTLNRKHFVRLHQQCPSHAGIVVCSFDPDFVGQAARIHAAVSALPELAGQPLRINRPLK